MPQTILNNYSEFVEQLTSRPSNELDAMNHRIDELRTTQKDVNMSLLITGGDGEEDALVFTSLVAGFIGSLLVLVGFSYI